MSILNAKTMSVEDLHLLMRLEKMLTMGEVRGIQTMFKDYGGESSFEGVMNTKSGNVTNSIAHTALRILCICGVIKKRGCGCDGTFVKILKPEILIALIELEQN